MLRHIFNNLSEIIQGKIPVAIIDMCDYGMMNGEKVLQLALDII